jgi:K+-transporting ATPase ATPase C chain
MLRDLKASLTAVVLLTIVLGFAYPAVMTVFGQLAFPHKADGSLIKVGDRVVGSKLAAQEFKSPSYFHPRPSAVGYNAAGTSFANFGPTSPALAKAVVERARAILKLEAPYNPGLTRHDIPVDAVTTSASGIDPDISPANARLQSRRIAVVRHLSLATVERLVKRYTDGRSLGFLGEPGVNVLELNIALDRETGR